MRYLKEVPVGAEFMHACSAGNGYAVWSTGDGQQVLAYGGELVISGTLEQIAAVEQALVQGVLR